MKERGYGNSKPTLPAGERAGQKFVYIHIRTCIYCKRRWTVLVASLKINVPHKCCLAMGRVKNQRQVHWLWQQYSEVCWTKRKKYLLHIHIFHVKLHGLQITYSSQKLSSLHLMHRHVKAGEYNRKEDREWTRSERERRMRWVSVRKTRPAENNCWWKQVGSEAEKKWEGRKTQKSGCR